MGRRLCVGDIHGSYDRLQQVLEHCKFSDSDTLYSVGDFTDRGNQNVKVLDFLMSLNNFKPVCGNHDLWNYEYLHPQVPYKHTTWEGKVREGFRPYMSRDAEDCWYGWNGGRKTLEEEAKQSEDWRNKVYNFLKNIPYRINLGDKIIIHSACPSTIYKWVDTPLDEITMETLKSSGLIRDDVYDQGVWNREIIKGCKDYVQIGNKYSSFDPWYKDLALKDYDGRLIYIIGHTPLDHPFYDKDLGIIGIDTCAFADKRTGWDIEGYLTILDIDTLDYWTSEKDEKKHLEAT